MLRFLTAGESHGRCLTAVLEGIPAGLKLEERFINEDLARRQSGLGRGKRMEIEKDTVELLSGIRDRITIGSPISLLIKNRDFKIDELPSITHPRPGHADLAGGLKYDRSDMRDILERSSARETAAKTAVGAICRIFLKDFGIEILSHVVKIGNVETSLKNMAFDEILKRKAHSLVNCADQAAGEEMIALIESISRDKDTLGGVFEIIIRNVPAGLGSHVQWDRRLNARLSYALMGIQAIKGVEVGMGFGSSNIPGSRYHDEIFYSKAKGFFRKTNNAGGIEGGISNGEEIVLRAVMKPIATLGKPLRSVDIVTKKECTASVERADVCAVPAAGVVGEAVCAFVIADCMIEKFGSDSMVEIKRNFNSYVEQIKKY